MNKWDYLGLTLVGDDIPDVILNDMTKYLKPCADGKNDTVGEDILKVVMDCLKMHWHEPEKVGQCILKKGATQSVADITCCAAEATKTGMPGPILNNFEM